MSSHENSMGEEIIDNIPVGAGVFDVSEGVIRLIYLNDGFYQMIGTKREDRKQYMGSGTIMSVHPDDRGGLFEEARASLEECRDFRYRFRNLDGNGEYVWLEITASHRKLDEDTERFYAVYYDVNSYMQEQTVAHAHYENSLNDILSAVPDSLGIARADLTEGTYSWTSVPPTVPDDTIWPVSWDDMVRQIASGIPEEREKHVLDSLMRDRLLDAFDRDETYQTCEYNQLGRDGKLRWVSSHVRMLRNPENGHVEGIAYTVDDTDEVRRADVLKIITSRSFDLVAFIHLDDRTFEAVYLGETLPAVYRKLLPQPGSIADFDAVCAESALHLDNEVRKSYLEKISSGYIRRELERNGGSYEFTLEERFEDRGPDLVYRKYQHFCLEHDSETVLVIESDVTAEVLRQREADAAALAQAKRDRMIMDSIMGAICILKMTENGDISVDYFNSYVFEMLGYDPTGLPQTPEDAKGTPSEPLFADALTFIHPDDRGYVKSMYLEHRDDESFSLEPYRMVGNGGEIHWLKVKVRKGPKKDGCRLYYVAMPDITQEVNLQAELAKQVKEEQTLRKKADAANAAKSDFLSRMSHDIRTPLNGIIGMTYLSQGLDLPEQARDNLEKVDTSAKFLLGLINDILDMAKVESGEQELYPEPYPIDEFNGYLDAVIRPLCDSRGLQLVVDENASRELIPLIDKNCLNKILFNLLSNAVKFTPEGGMVTYTNHSRKVAENRILIINRIEDNGIGMSEEFQKKLFTPFTQEGRNDTSDARGSGLGLAIVKKLVDLMGGSIEVESQLGKGSVFEVRIECDAISPQELAATSKPETTATLPSDTLEGMHVLLCEDHPLNQQIAKEILEKKGVVVEVADNGQTGLEMFKRSEPGHYDAILMDVRMPVMDGYQASRAIRETERSDSSTIPIIAMTADAFKEDVKMCLDSGMDSHIPKPVEPERLYQTMREAHMGRKNLTVKI